MSRAGREWAGSRMGREPSGGTSGRPFVPPAHRHSTPPFLTSNIAGCAPLLVPLAAATTRCDCAWRGGRAGHARPALARCARTAEARPPLPPPPPWVWADVGCGWPSGRHDGRRGRIAGPAGRHPRRQPLWWRSWGGGEGGGGRWQSHAGGDAAGGDSLLPPPPGGGAIRDRGGRRRWRRGLRPPAAATPSSGLCRKRWGERKRGSVQRQRGKQDQATTSSATPSRGTAPLTPLAPPLWMAWRVLPLPR